MTVSLKHAFTSNVADSSDASLVQPSNWNAEHTLTAGADTLLGAVTAGAVTEITCTSAGRALLDDADAAAQRTTLSAAGTGVTNTFTANQIISVTDNTNAALRVTQLGTGNAILVEDSTNPDSTPFVVTSAGNVGIGVTSPSYPLHVATTGTASSIGGVLIGNNGTTVQSSIGELSLQSTGANSVSFYTNSTERMNISGGGYVAINTTPQTYAQLRMKNDRAATAYAYVSDTHNGATFENSYVQGFDGGVTFLGNYQNFPVTFITNNQERMRIASNGNISMGNADTTYPLHLFRASGELKFNIESGTTGQDTYINFTNGSFSGNEFLVGLAGAATGSYIWDRSSGRSIIFGTNDQERMRIATGGNVGVGTTNPQARLEVVGPTLNTSTPTTYAVNIANSGGGATSDISLGSDASYAYMQSFSGKPLYLNSQGNSVVVGTGGLRVATTSIGAGRVNISGYQDGTFYGIFMTPTSNTATPIAFTNAAGTIVGTIATNATNTAYYTSSDYRLKKDIRSVSNPIGRLNSLKPVNFAWNATDERVDGFIAHEVQSVVPEAIWGEKDAVDKNGKPVYQCIDQAKIVPLVVAALQDAVKRIDRLEAEISAQKTTPA